MHSVYFISGLGADERVFARLSLPSHYRLVHIQWIDPERGESLPQYAQRLSGQIDLAGSFSLIGLSFGGILATEMSKFLKPERTIILSSVTRHTELPWHYRLLGKFRLNRLVPSFFYTRPTQLTYRIFGASREEDKRMLRQIIRDTPPGFLRWAIDRLLRWRHSERLPGIFHIHGTRDNLLPVKQVRPDLVIRGGGHLMVYTHADEVSEVISSLLPPVEK